MSSSKRGFSPLLFTTVAVLFTVLAALLLVAAGLLIYRERAAKEADSDKTTTIAGQGPDSPAAVVRPDVALASQVRSPDFILPTLDGNISLADYRGQYVLINFWATWCPPCQIEMPELHAYYMSHRDEGFMLLAVDVAEDAALVRDFVGDYGYVFPVALDTAGQVFAQYVPNDILPSSFLIGPEGSVVYAWSGRITHATLEQFVTPLLEG